MKKFRIWILAIVALLAILLAIYVVQSTNRINKLIDEEIQPTTGNLEKNNEDVTLNTESIDALQESFDALFSGEELEGLYEGQTDYGFIDAVEE